MATLPPGPTMAPRAEAGPFTSQVRSECEELWRKELKELEMPHTKGGPRCWWGVPWGSEAMVAITRVGSLGEAMGTCKKVGELPPL